MNILVQNEELKKSTRKNLGDNALQSSRGSCYCGCGRRHHHPLLLQAHQSSFIPDRRCFHSVPFRRSGLHLRLLSRSILAHQVVLTPSHPRPGGHLQLGCHLCPCLSIVHCCFHWPVVLCSSHGLLSLSSPQWFAEDNAVTLQRTMCKHAMGEKLLQNDMSFHCCDCSKAAIN